MTKSRRRVFDAAYVGAAAHVLGILSNETRLNMVLTLAQGEANVSEICQHLDLPQSNASHHLRILRDTGLVEDRREGQYVVYCLNIPMWTTIADGFFDSLLEGRDDVELRNFRIRRLSDEDADR